MRPAAATTMRPTTAFPRRLTRLPVSSLAVIVSLVIGATPTQGFFFFQWPDDAYQCNVSPKTAMPRPDQEADLQTHRLTWANATPPFKAFVV